MSKKSVPISIAEKLAAMKGDSPSHMEDALSYGIKPKDLAKVSKPVAEILAEKLAEKAKKEKELKADTLAEAKSGDSEVEKWEAKLTGGFNLYASRHREIFNLAAPAMLTVKDRKGQYKKQTFVGGDSFIPSSIYKGKRKKFILVFTPATPSSFASMEMEMDAAKTHFPEFQAYFEAAVKAIFGDAATSPDSVMQEAHQKKQQEESQDRYEGNPLFASW